MLRSVLSILAGIAVLTIASFAIEAALGPLLLHAFPNALPNPEALSTNPWVRRLTFAYGALCVAAGGYVTALIARRKPVHHAGAMGIFQAGLTIMAMLSAVGNHISRTEWIITAVLTVPAAMLGGLVYRWRTSDRQLDRTSANAGSLLPGSPLGKTKESISPPGAFRQN